MTLRFAVDSWEPEFTGDPVTLNDTTAAVEVGAEVAAPAWAPVPPTTIETPESIAFVDGVRRTDARIWIERDDATVVPGVCASVGAGLVRARPGAAHLENCSVRRIVAAPSDVVAPIVTSIGMFEPQPAASVETVMIAVQSAMAHLESDLAVGSGCELTVVDGPLRDAYRLTGAVGFVKTHHTSYLPPELDAVVSVLDAGERTPVFHVDGTRSFWSWYLRLPGPRTHARAGIVRLEASGQHDRRAAVRLACVTAAVLGRFASQAHKDPRAPQNLSPIGGIERGVKHRLGHPTLVRRALLDAASRPV